MFAFISLLIFICMAVLMVRLFAGPTLYDRVLALNTFGSCTVLLIGAVGFLFGRPDFLDIALAYALMNFISVLGVLRFFEYNRAENPPDGAP